VLRNEAQGVALGEAGDLSHTIERAAVEIGVLIEAGSLDNTARRGLRRLVRL
jgi:hypothetical protein